MAGASAKRNPNPQDLGVLPWAGETIICVASGESAKDVDLSLARGKARVMTVNESWRLAPWADSLYACDRAWWLKPPAADKGPPAPHEFAGLRITQDRAAALQFGLLKVALTRGVDQLLTERPGVLGWGGNGGFHNLNIAVQARPSRLLLVGYDLQGGHWHGRHPPGLNNPNSVSLARWARILDAQAPVFAALGIEVLNTSPVSALTAYPVVTLAAALN